MRVAIEAVGVVAPGFPDWEIARAVLAGREAFATAPVKPCMPVSLPPAERRRSSPTVRLAIATAEQALQRTVHPAQEMSLVFSSSEAAGVITHQLCEALAGSREVSPTQFSNSVHNAPSGYYSIAMNAKLGAISVCHGPWSFAAGLLAAAVQARCDGMPVLYVCYDSPLPAPLSEAMPVVEETAIALVIAPGASSDAIATWEIAVVPSGDEVDWPHWMPPAWQANASARGFDALATLSNNATLSAALPLYTELHVRDVRC